MLDYLGSVRLKIDRDKPLSECVSVELRPSPPPGDSGCIGDLYLNSAKKEILFAEVASHFRVSEIV